MKVKTFPIVPNTMHAGRPETYKTKPRAILRITEDFPPPTTQNIFAKLTDDVYPF